MDMKLLLCKTTNQSDQVTNFIRRSDANCWGSSMLACSECSDKYYRADLVTRIPTPQAILRDFELVEYNLE
ncbi:unnamed protein product [Moneuplotes crassus]|uniref:Uncharacterized protein n=1 Tax=Euplotes crassus TaxID=5936 RepID=A0AAD1UCY2_EUPCR|nr:unnamed protein product [Moneuplotes crassus]